ncbi:hypothetical protein B0T22DRAFT_478552 [Podospora appendiculata]|uniref:Uncharacterized protein n=1 Tax=Podospora appendiculata TaxID=314037 RepID=A0AAE0X722_9PEZI|nr:hypothetical protein B0T22DRAFT_478552 [Podospora appendiculata]
MGLVPANQGNVGSAASTSVKPTNALQKMTSVDSPKLSRKCASGFHSLSKPFERRRFSPYARFRRDSAEVGMWSYGLRYEKTPPFLKEETAGYGDISAGSHTTERHLMATFHPFPRLRLRIWELTTEPRVVVVRERGRIGTRAFFASPTPAFAYGMQPRYTWVNFAVDTIHTDDFTIKSLVVEHPLIRWLTIDAADSEFFYHVHMAGIVMSDMPALERLVILTHENVYEWESIMEDLRRYFDERQAAMPGRPFTNVCIVDQSTGETVDAANYKEVFQGYEDMYLRAAEYENPTYL